MKKPLIAFALLLAFGATTAHAKAICRKSAIAAAKIAAPNLKQFADVNPTEETPDIISYEVTLANVMPEPSVTTTIEVTLAKSTCALIANPLQK